MLAIKQPYDPVEITAVLTLIYGQPGIGKTVFGTYLAPAPLLLDFDSGTRRVKPRFRVPRLELKTWNDALDVLQRDLSMYQTLIIDTAGKMFDFIKNYLIEQNPKLRGSSGGLTQNGWGEAGNYFKDFCDAARAKGLHMIFIAHDKEVNDGETTVIRPDVPGSSAKYLVREMDLIGYMESRNNTRTISFTPSDKYIGKNTLELPGVISIPDLDITAKENVQYSMINIIKNYKERQVQDAEMHQQFDEHMDVIRTKIAAIQDLVTAEQIGNELAEMPALHDSKHHSALLLRNRLNDLGIAFVKLTGKYYYKDSEEYAKVKMPAGVQTATQVVEKKVEMGSPVKTEEKPADPAPPSLLGLGLSAAANGVVETKPASGGLMMQKVNKVETQKTPDESQPALNFDAPDGGQAAV